MNKEYNLGILEDEEYLVLLGILANSNIDSDDMIKFNDYIIPLWKENKDLKEEIKKLQRIVISKQEDYLIISVGEITKVFKLNDNKKWINEVGDSNE